MTEEQIREMVEEVKQVGRATDEDVRGWRVEIYHYSGEAFQRHCYVIHAEYMGDESITVEGIYYDPTDAIRAAIAMIEAMGYTVLQEEL